MDEVRITKTSVPTEAATKRLMFFGTQLAQAAVIFPQVFQNAGFFSRSSFKIGNQKTTTDQMTTINENALSHSDLSNLSKETCDISLELDYPDLDPLTSSSIPISIEHNDMELSSSVLLSGEPLGAETLEHQIEQFEEGLAEEEVTESDYDLLKRITTNIGDYDPLNHDKPIRFIPVLEAKGVDDVDKNESGHRGDTLPIANAVDQFEEMKTNSAVFQFLEEDKKKGKKIPSAAKSNLVLKKFLAMNAQGIIVRNNPGTLSAHSQKNFDDMLRDLSDSGLAIMNHPDVSSTLGAKDVSMLLPLEWTLLFLKSH